jgi:hypothetical protein
LSLGVGRPDHHADVSTIREIDGHLLDRSGMQPTFITRISRGRLAMPIPATRVPPALKHGAYSKAALLLGEDPAAFEDLHRGLIAEITPHGRMEEETVATLAHLMWRRQNLAKFEIGQLSDLLAKDLRAAADESQQYENSKEDGRRTSWLDKLDGEQQLQKTAEENRKAAAVESLDLTMKQLQVEERLDAMIDRLIKRLLLVRGVKSIMSSAPTVSPSSAKRVPPI